VAQVAERAAYVVAAADDPLPTTASDDEVLRWWPRHAARLPAFASAAKGVLLLTPTSAAVERAFSLLRMLSDAFPPAPVPPSRAMALTDNT